MCACTGTLITEWDAGRERCEQFLQTEEAYVTLAEKLIQIAAYYKFDGWLINIENKIEVSYGKLQCQLFVLEFVTIFPFVRPMAVSLIDALFYLSESHV